MIKLNENSTYSGLLEYFKEIGVKVTINFIGAVQKVDWDNCTHNVYKIRIQRGKSYSIFDFTDSIYNTQKGIKMSSNNEDDVEEIMDCIISDYSCKDYSYEEFCDEFGYDSYNANYTGRDKKSNKIYRAIISSAEKLDKIFSEKEIDMIESIINN